MQLGLGIGYQPDPENPMSLNNTTVYAIYGDSQNRVWLATDEGVNLYDPLADGFIHYTHNNNDSLSLGNNELLCFQEDENGQIWIGTYGSGIDKLDPESGRNRLNHRVQDPRTGGAARSRPNGGRGGAPTSTCTTESRW